MQVTSFTFPLLAMGETAVPMLDDITRLDRAPELFQPGDAPYRAAPHISEGLLAAHLDETTGAASRSPASRCSGRGRA